MALLESRKLAKLQPRQDSLSNCNHSKRRACENCRKQSKHENYVAMLQGIIGEEYDEIMANTKLFSSRNKVMAEADLIAVKNDYVDIYEVKCSYRPTKAKKQLARLRRLLSQKYRVRNLYFFPGNMEQIILLNF